MNEHFLLADILKTKEIRDTYMKNYNLTEEKLIEIRKEKNSRKKISLDFREKVERVEK